uniref:Uncharacterized protein n=1 Tax=Arundo donax TaxID=35708 RepID=A0A0A9AFU7_ARUDO
MTASNFTYRWVGKRWHIRNT